VTGLYFLENTASERAKTLTKSGRGELEITVLLEMYLADGTLDVHKMGCGYAWLGTGTHDSLLDAASFVRTLQKRQGLLVGSPEEIALENGWITREDLAKIVTSYRGGEYASYLSKLL
jgi:glucose-1-phosphate thymidylyltransferase